MKVLQPASQTSADRDRLARKKVAAAAGVILFAAFFGLTRTAPGLRISFLAPFTRSNAGEVYFWLGHALLLFPGTCLIGYALANSTGGALQKLWNRVERCTSRERALGLAAVFICAAALARIGRWLFLQDFPVTDDEYAAMFGGQVLSLGKLAVPMLQPIDALPTRFLYLRDGMLTSFDWPGIQIAWAIAEWTRTGTWIFSVIAAIPVVALGILVGRRLSTAWGMVATGILLFSPMFFGMSMTSHAHLLSRAMIALALLFHVLAEGQGRSRWWFLVGLCAGAALLSRPFETLFLLMPLSAQYAFDAIRRRPARVRALGWALAGIMGPVVIFAIHNHLVTGAFWLPARFAPNPLLTMEWRRPSESFGNLSVLWDRFGANTSYNLFMLAIWFFGPLGIALVVAGVMTDRLTRTLGMGVASWLGLALLHDNQGLHLLGPIHYTEAVVPLTVIAVHGLHNLTGWCAVRSVDRRTLASVLAFSAVLGLGIFNLWNGLAVRRQSQIQADVYGFIDSAHLQRAVILAPQFGRVWQNPAADYKSIGLFVFEWRRPHPDWSDEVLIFREEADASALRRRFPDRQFFRLRPQPRPPYLALVPLEPGLQSKN